ncbi:MAG: hypothetical protein KatS3mg002_1586 [Candidatus Woesearchaeota archaeon]|nr:MAG: hypothetical protein KatS3mg002_1586 [Candidatus Woesearchaeota archaeon]
MKSYRFVYDVFLDIFRLWGSKYDDGLFGKLVNIVNSAIAYFGIVIGVWKFDIMLVMWLVWVRFLIKFGVVIKKDRYGEIEEWIYIVYGISTYLTGIIMSGMILKLIISI